MTAPRQPAGAYPRPAAGYTDTVQQIRRALLWYAFTGTPAPYPGMPNWRDLVDEDGVPAHDLIRLLKGLITNGPIGAGLDQIAMYADQLRDVLADGGVGTTAEAYAESMLLDAINTCAPDREGTA